MKLLYISIYASVMELALGIKLIKVMSLASAGYICPFSIKHID